MFWGCLSDHKCPCIYKGDCNCEAGMNFWNPYFYFIPNLHSNLATKLTLWRKRSHLFKTKAIFKRMLHTVIWPFKLGNNSTFVSEPDSVTRNLHHQVVFIRWQHVTQLKYKVESCSGVSFNWVTRTAVNLPQSGNYKMDIIKTHSSLHKLRRP